MGLFHRPYHVHSLTELQEASRANLIMSSFASSSSTPQHQAELFRKLTWDATVSLFICLAADELPAGSDRSIDSLQVRAGSSERLSDPG